MLNSITDLAPFLADEDKCRKLFEDLRWPNGVVCPKCGHDERIYELKGTTTGRFKCGSCRKQFTVRVGTIFEDSKLPLSKWLYAIWLMCSSKKGVSAAQLQRELGITYKSAWFVCHRVRHAISAGVFGDKLKGPVEIDETYIGGKPKNNRRKPKHKFKKATVVTMIERETGRAATYPMPNANKPYMQALVKLTVDSEATLMTDEHPSYVGLDAHFAGHERVQHSKEYVRGNVHINFAESYHSLLKRGLFGTYHHVSKKHLPKYLREFEYRWNTRHMTDGERTIAAIQMAPGRRLYYSNPK